MPDSPSVSRELSPNRPQSRARAYGSRASSRARYSRNSSRASLAYTPVPENLILPEGPIGEEAAELLHELVHPRHRDEEGALFGDRADDDQGSEDGDSDTSSVLQRAKLPWYKRPSPLWYARFQMLRCSSDPPVTAGF